MSSIKNLSSDLQWFTEASLPYSEPDIKLSTRVSEVLFDEASEFGQVQVFDTPFYGRMLSLDGIIQVAEKDEFIYHEMMVILPAIKHGNPKSILIVGGGDGGAVKQALRIKSIEKVVLVEIDQSVIDVCKQYIPSIGAGALDNEKVEIVIADGNKYVKECQERFDIVAMDLTDPIPGGPAEELYKEEFYKDVKKILSETGVLSTHCSSLVLQPEEAKTMLPRLKHVFEEVVLHTAVIPTYQLTSFGFIIARAQSKELSVDDIEDGFLNIDGHNKYLSLEMFDASQIIPPYIKEQIS